MVFLFPLPFVNAGLKIIYYIQKIKMLETFRGRVFVKVSDNPHIKVLAGALFPSSVIRLKKKLAWHQIFVMKIIAVYITK